MGFIRLTQEEKDALQLELVPREARRELTRLIRRACTCEVQQVALTWENEFINIANNVLERPGYVLKSDDWGEYEPAEYAWHKGERELIMRLPTTVELAEILADYLQQGMLLPEDVNSVLAAHNCGFSFRRREASEVEGPHVSLNVAPLASIPEADLTSEHPNIRKLVERMDRSVASNDDPGVLHAAASIFETLAKDVMQNPNVENQTLGSFFDGYRKKSKLPEPLLDYMLQVYNDRNTIPLAGHGSLSLSPPSLNHGDAVLLVEMTKAIVRAERSLSELALKQSSLRSTSKRGK